MVQSSLATKSQSFDLVKSEIEQTIRQAESSLERFQENRESGEDLQNCVDFLNLSIAELFCKKFLWISLL